MTVGTMTAVAWFVAFPAALALIGGYAGAALRRRREGADGTDDPAPG